MILHILIVLRDCAPVNQNQLLDYLSELKADLQKSNYIDLPDLPYSRKSGQNYAVENFDAAELDSLPEDKDKRLPPLPWNKRLPALPWDKRSSKRRALPSLAME